VSDKIAKFISILLHPLLMPTLIFVVIFYYMPILIKPLPNTAYFRVLAIIFVLTYLIPLVSIILMRLHFIVDMYRIYRLKMTENISYHEAVVRYQSADDESEVSERPSLWMKHRKERIMPFLFVAFYYGLCTYLFIRGGELNFIFPLILGSITITIIIITLITARWKISAHSAGVAGFLGFLLSLNLRNPGSELLIPVVLVTLLCGLVMSSRLRTNDHSSQEVYAGAALGFAISFCAIFFLL